MIFRLLLFSLFAILVVISGISCDQIMADSSTPDVYEIIPLAPHIQYVSENHKLMIPYIQYPRVRVLKNGSPDNGNPLVSVNIVDWNHLVEDQTRSVRIYTDQEPNPNVQPGQPDFIGVNGIGAYTPFGTYADANNAPYFVYYFTVQGTGIYCDFRIGIARDNENTDLFTSDNPPQRYTHQRDFGKNPPEEVPGDGFGGSVEDETSGAYFGLVDPQEKDLFIELDLLQGDNWLYNSSNRNLIVSTLESIFTSADINVHIFIDYIQSNVPPQATWDDCKEFLASERDIRDQQNPPIGLGRKSIHVILLRKWGGPIDQGRILWGQTIQYFGNGVKDGVPQGEGRFEYQCYKATYINDGISLDSAGCVIFWDEIIDQNHESSYNNNNWSRLEVLCHDIAHEVGHAMGIINPEPRQIGNINQGCIMSHEAYDGYFSPKHPHSLEFYQNNIDNLVAIDHADAINLKDLLGTNTTSIRTGWYAAPY